MDFDTHGKKVREDRPHEYLKIVASLVPKQMEIENSAQPFAVIPAQMNSAVELARVYDPAHAATDAEDLGC